MRKWGLYDGCEEEEGKIIVVSFDPPQLHLFFSLFSRHFLRASNYYTIRVVEFFS